MARPISGNSHGPGLEICYVPPVVVEDSRERLIDATLDLCIRCGYEATTIDEIAAAANVAPSDFARHFATKDAVLLCIVEDLVNATGSALGHVDAAARPEQALLIATTEVITAITEGRGVITCDRMLAMAEIVTANANLRKQASLTRKRVLTQALADRMGVAADNRRVRRAVTTWSAIASGAYLNAGSMGEHYDPRQDDQLKERGIAELTASFSDVMGDDPPSPS
jgi:AcrR family transcriptional regulator